MKKIVLALGVLSCGSLLWYLFLKPYDYKATIIAKTFPGTINQLVKSWGANLDNATDIQQENLRLLRQELVFNDSVHRYQWEITPLTDSTSTIDVYVQDLRHSPWNRLTLPFRDTDFEKRTRKNLLDFHQLLVDHVKEFRITLQGMANMEATYCACTRFKGHQFDKARGMMKDYPLLGSVLAENNIPLNGTPFLEITYWDMARDSIEYDFCFPILKTEGLPQHPEITYREFPEKKALKALYNGNYITSDRSWYALLEDARKKGLEVTGLPVEVFYTNPNMGGDALRWKAEIFMPIKDDDD